MRIRLFTNQHRNQYIFNGTEKSTTSENPLKIDVQPKEKPEKTSHTGSAIAIATIASVISVFMLSRGFQKNANKFLNKIKKFVEERLARSSLKKTKNQKNIYDFLIRRINSFIKKSESINNITSLKDVLFMKMMYKTEPTKKIHESISKYFGNISQKTVFNSYKKTEEQFKQMNKIFDELDNIILTNSANEKVDIDGQEYTKQVLVEQAKDYRDIANMAVQAFINKSTIQTRFDYINKVTSSLYSTFWNASFKDFWSKNNKFKRKEMWQTFIAAEQVKGDKTQLAKIISYVRNAITYTKTDESAKVHDYIKALDGIISEKDKEGVEIIKRLEWYSGNPEIFEKNKELFLNELKKFEAHKMSLSTDEKTAQVLEEYKKTNVDSIYKQIKDNKPGAIQDMLDIYYKIAPFELEKTGALLSLKKAVKTLNKSIDLECSEFFDKIRDLKLGSAPTDVLTILFSFVALSAGLGHAQDNDRRKSIMLMSGIPIVGGIAATTYTAAKLVSGGKSLAFGFLSGIVLNQLGKIADNFRKKIAVDAK